MLQVVDAARQQFVERVARRRAVPIELRDEMGEQLVGVALPTTDGATRVAVLAGDRIVPASARTSQ